MVKGDFASSGTGGLPLTDRTMNSGLCPTGGHLVLSDQMLL